MSIVALKKIERKVKKQERMEWDNFKDEWGRLNTCKKCKYLIVSPRINQDGTVETMVACGKYRFLRGIENLDVDKPSWCPYDVAPYCPKCKQLFFGARFVSSFTAYTIPKYCQTCGSKIINPPVPEQKNLNKSEFCSDGIYRGFYPESMIDELVFED